jgi:hypothetical protein
VVSCLVGFGGSCLLIGLWDAGLLRNQTQTTCAWCARHSLTNTFALRSNCLYFNEKRDETCHLIFKARGDLERCAQPIYNRRGQGKVTIIGKWLVPTLYSGSPLIDGLHDILHSGW